MDTKICSMCKRGLPVAQFRLEPRTKSGIKTECKECEKTRTYAWRKTEKGKACEKTIRHKYNESEHGKSVRTAYRQTDAMKRARKRWRQSEAGKESERRYRQSAKRKAVLSRYNQSGKYKTMRSRAAKSPLGKVRLARSNHKRRILLGQTISTLTLQEWQAIKKKQQGRCFYCKEKKPLTMDHLAPLSLGGQHTAQNTVAACRPCNSKKSNHLLPVTLLGI